MFRNATARMLVLIGALGVQCLLASTAQAATGGGAGVVVNGVVKDGSGQGWPLYAQIDITGPSVEMQLFTDPVTGYYSATLPAGATYAFAVHAVSQGYTATGGPVNLPAAASLTDSPTALVISWTLSAGAPCTAPGYAPGSFSGPPVLTQGFDSGNLPAGWTVQTTSGNSWQIATGADPCFQFDDNRTGGSGPYAILNSACFSNFFDTDDSSLVTPAFDLSASTGVAIQWANDFIDNEAGSVADVDVSSDGGATWTNVWDARTDVPGPGNVQADLSPAAGHSGVQARFHYTGLWAWWWQVDDVLIGNYACTPMPGGLVVGTVSDGNSPEIGLTGASILTLPDGGSTTTFATPHDPNQGDGLYILFAESGAQSFEASQPAYTSVTKDATVIPNSTMRLDFALPAGRLGANPLALDAVVSPGGTEELTLTMSNTGTGDGSFVIKELGILPEVVTARPVSLATASDRKAALKRVPFRLLGAMTAKGLPAVPKAPVHVPQFAGAGNVISSFPSGLTGGWGLAYDTDSNRLWISNPAVPIDGDPGDGFEYEYQPDGTQSGATIDIHDTGGDWQADGTYNARTGMLWQLNNGGDNCLFEMDPVAKVVTGKKICGTWTASRQQGVAYDYATDTYYVGGWNDTVIYHIDGNGTVLDSAFVGLTIAGLAYNSSTGHLFVITQFGTPFDCWVVDTRNNYTVISGFSVTSAGVPVLQGDGVSLEADCNGHLWAYHRLNDIVYEFESGETGWCPSEIPWVSENPTTGTIAGSGAATVPVTVTFESQGLLPGLRQGELIFSTDTPTPIAPVPVSLTVLFGDVPTDSFAANFIYAAAGSGVMPGCAPQAPAFSFCPNDVVTRRSMAGFIERAAHGATAPPPVYLGEFNDVLSGSFNANYIQGLVDDAITAGCGGGSYCPDVPNTRAQMAVFIWKARHGAAAPPACTPPGTFADVPCPDGFAVDDIEAIAAEGVTAGCGNGNYCPTATITNAQMAVFLVKAFNLPYLP